MSSATTGSVAGLRTVGPARALALLGTILLVLAVDVGLVIGRTRPPPAPVEDPPSLEAALGDLVAFVERERGLRFREPPDVRLLPDEEFEATLLEPSASETDSDIAAQREADRDFARLLRALGLVEGPVDFDEVSSDAVARIVGVYDTETKVLYARGDEPTPYVLLVLVHELTHALDDQHFGIDRPDLDDDAAAAFDALVEGSAVAVEEQWLASRPVAEQRRITAVDGGAGRLDGAGRSDVFEALLDFPYAVGPSFVRALLDAGGPGRVDEAFRQPPTTTEQLLHPERYLSGEGPVGVAAPAADGTVIDEGSLGELFLVLTLDETAKRETARRAAAGWGGDRYVVWARGRQSCLRWTIAMDTPADAAELRDTLRPWLADHRRATVSPTDPLVLTNCA